MLVIHPSDKTTDFLRTLYEGREDVRLLTGGESRKELGSILYHLRPGERVMLLGHGTDAGLFRLEDDGEYRLYVCHTMAYALRKHPVIGIWCHADLFARKEHLHGLFSGMIVSEMTETEEYDIACLQDDLDFDNVKLAENMRALLDEEVPFHEIPKRMAEMDTTKSQLTTFNYNNFYNL
ncbi:MAG: hypothetical protein ACI4TU_04125 [Candidatus Cryptobacteroides sp.]